MDAVPPNPAPTASSPAPDTRAVPAFAPVRPRRAIEEITGQIRDLIRDGALREGDKLPAERALAAQLDVSRSTLREALRMLEIGGFVVQRKGAKGGSFITAADRHGVGEQRVGPLRLTDFSVADLTRAMRAVTAMLVEAALPSLTEDDLAAMAANIAAAEALGSDPEGRSDLLIAFYRLLAEATGSPVLVALTTTFVDLLRDWVRRAGAISDDRVIKARRVLLGHLQRRDAKAALRGVDAYFEGLHDYWLRDHRPAAAGPAPGGHA